MNMFVASTLSRENTRNETSDLFFKLSEHTVWNIRENLNHVSATLTQLIQLVNRIND